MIESSCPATACGGYLSSPATSSSRAAAWLELTCTAENVFLCARVGFKTCTRAIHVLRVCERACERAGQCASERASERAASERAASSERASSEQRAAASVHSSFVISSLGTNNTIYIHIYNCMQNRNEQLNLKELEHSGQSLGPGLMWSCVRA